MVHMMKIIYNVTDNENDVSFIADSEQITLLYETYHLTHNVENATKCELIAKPRRISQ